MRLNYRSNSTVMMRKSIAAVFVRLISQVFLIHLFYFSVMAFDLAPEPTLTTSRPSELWRFLPLGYLFSVAIETPVLIIGLPRILSFKQRFFAGLWLTACTYPIVVLVLPILYSSSSRWLYLLVAETFAPVAECALFWLAFRHKFGDDRKAMLRSFAVIIIANLLSFGAGELLNASRWVRAYQRYL